MVVIVIVILKNKNIYDDDNCVSFRFVKPFE